MCVLRRYSALARAGAELIAVPAAFTVPTGQAHWEVLLRARAIETHCYVIAPAQGGKHEDGRSTYGHSVIIDPWGKVVAKLDHDEPGYIAADLDLDQHLAPAILGLGLEGRDIGPAVIGGRHAVRKCEVQAAEHDVRQAMRHRDPMRD